MLGSIDDTRRRLAEVLESADACDWDVAVQSSEEAYRSAVSQLEQEGIADPEQYGELVEQARRLEAEIDRLGAEEKRARELEQEAAELLAQYRKARTQLSGKRQDFASRVSGDTLRVEVERLAEHSDLAENLVEILGIEAFNEDRKVIAERIKPQDDSEWDWGSLDKVVAAIRAFQSGRPSLGIRKMPGSRPGSGIFQRSGSIDWLFIVQRTFLK